MNTLVKSNATGYSTSTKYPCRDGESFRWGESRREKAWGECVRRVPPRGGKWGERFVGAAGRRGDDRPLFFCPCPTLMIV